MLDFHDQYEIIALNLRTNLLREDFNYDKYI